MEKIAQRNIMAIYEDWRILRRILKHDLALDKMSGRRICPLGHLDGWWTYPLEFLDRLPIDRNRKVVGAEPEWS